MLKNNYVEDQRYIVELALHVGLLKIDTFGKAVRVALPPEQYFDKLTTLCKQFNPTKE